MRPSTRSAGLRLASLAVVVLSAGACATAESGPSPIGDELGEAGSASGGRSTAGGAGLNSAAGAGGNGSSGSGIGGASAGSSNTPGGAAGAVAQGGTSAAGAGSAGKAGASSAGASSGGKGGGGASSGGAPSAGASNGGAPSAGASNAGAPGAGASSGGAGGAASGGTCDAAHAVATVATSTTYTGKATDCVRLTVNPTWATVQIQLQPLPSTAAYPVPYAFFSCAGNGTGSLTADYASVTLKSGANPGCDYFVQFKGGATTVKFTYYD